LVHAVTKTALEPIAIEQRQEWPLLGQLKRLRAKPLYADHRDHLIRQNASDCGGRLEVFEAGHVFRGGIPGFTGKSGAGLVTHYYVEFNKGRIPVVVGARDTVDESCGWINPRLVRDLPGGILHSKAVAPIAHNDLCALEQRNGVYISDAQTISQQPISNLPCPRTTTVELKLA
jgi:hypothetical protein